MKPLTDRINDLAHQIRGTTFADLAARDILAEMSELLDELSRRVDDVALRVATIDSKLQNHLDGNDWREDR